MQNTWIQGDRKLFLGNGQCNIHGFSGAKIVFRKGTMQNTWIHGAKIVFRKGTMHNTTPFNNFAKILMHMQAHT